MLGKTTRRRRRTRSHTRRMSAKARERWRKAGKVALWITAGLSAWELYLATVLRKQRLRDTFNAALRRAQETGKPLLVVGLPEDRLLARTLGADWDCAQGCLTFDALPAAANAAVIFSAFELERDPNPAARYAQLREVSGGDLFLVSVEPYSVLSLLPRRREVLALTAG